MTSGRCAARSSSACSGSIRKSSSRGALDDLGPGDPRDVRVQRVGRLEHQGAATRPPEGQEQALQHLVRAVGAEHLVRRDAVQVGHGLPELGRRPVGIAVEGDLRQRGQQLLAPGVGRRERRLVGVEAHLRLDLGRVVALGQLEVGPHRRDGAHGGPRSGRSSAPSARAGAHRVGVRRQSLGLGQRDDERPERAQGVGRHPHRVHVLAEVVGAQRRGEARRPVGRQHVVGPRDVVPHAGRRPVAR